MHSLKIHQQIINLGLELCIISSLNDEHINRQRRALSLLRPSLTFPYTPHSVTPKAWHGLVSLTYRRTDIIMGRAYLYSRKH